MHIQYFGLTSFKLTTKDAVVITDPFSKETGLMPPRGSADILILSEKQNPLTSNLSGISGAPFNILDPGEYDVKGVTVTGIPLKQAGGYITIYLVESEEIKLLSLAHIKDFNIPENELEALGEIDILMLPVGGGDVLDASSAAKVVNTVEPRIVIPSYYATTGLKTAADKLEKFVKEMGGKSETLDKLIVKKKDLVSEDTKLVILETLR